MMAQVRSILVLSLLLTLAACSGSQPAVEEESHEASQSIDTCLSQPELANSWGECNVKKTIYDNLGKVRTCHAKNRAVKGTAMLKFRLRPNGQVRSLHLDQGGTRDKKLAACLSQAFSKVRFAPPPKGVKPTIFFPLDLNSGL